MEQLGHVTAHHAKDPASSAQPVKKARQTVFGLGLPGRLLAISLGVFFLLAKCPTSFSKTLMGSILIESRFVERPSPVLPSSILLVIFALDNYQTSGPETITGNTDVSVCGLSLGNGISAPLTPTARERKLLPSRYISLALTNSWR